MKPRFFGILVPLLLGALVLPRSVVAQAPATEPAVRVAGSVANLFETLDPSTPIAGARLRIPREWAVEEVYLLRYGTVDVPVEHREMRNGTVLVTAREPIRGPHEVVVRVRMGPSAGTYRWQLTPFEWVTRAGRADTTRHRQFLAAARRTHQVEIEDAPRPDRSNLALDLAGAEGPLLFQPRNPLSLGRSSSFTIEFWMRTSGLDEVVLSTWTGDEGRPYPAEFTVDRGGRLRFYCGRAGRHQALRTSRPVADGEWHHVAAVYDDAQSRVRLVLDGTAVDSMGARALPRNVNAMPLAIGGRRPFDGEAPKEQRHYTGRLDEIRIWPQVQSVAMLRRMMDRPISSSAASTVAPVRLGFDDESELKRLSWILGAERTPASLSFRSPLRNLRAHTEGRTVTLRWQSDAAGEGAFVVERSSNGSSFQQIDRVDPIQGAGPSGESREVVYRDENVQGQIVYYRIRQVSTETGVERMTGTVKIGLGSNADEQVTADLVGNFPNPFEETTTISYRIKETQPVTLTVWDLSGKRVSTLVDRVHEPGYYEQTLNAESLPSGTYFARLETDQGVQSHQMVLVK